MDIWLFLRRIVSQKTLLRHYQRLGLTIGKNSFFTRNTNFGSEPYLISIGNDVYISNGCTFVTHDGGVRVLRNIGLGKSLDFFAPITIGNNVFLGNKTTVLPGVTIGDNVVIGYGSIVTKSIPSNCVAAGVPCKIIESIKEYEEKKIPKCEQTKCMNIRQKRSYLIKKYTNHGK